MDLKQLIRDQLKTARTMQIATSVNNQPWACTVHFYNDDDFNFYWVSTPTRRHSKELEQNPNAAITIIIHEDTPSEKYVIGISAEGTAKILNNDETEIVGKKYFSSVGKDPAMLVDILEGKNPHKFYRFKPKNIVPFDYKNFPDNPRQEVNL